MSDPSSRKLEQEEIEDTEFVKDYFEQMQDEKEIDLDDEKEQQEEWDGFEVEMVADDDAELFDDEITGMRFKYVLEKEDIENTLKVQKIFKTRGKRAIIQSIIFSILLVVFGVNFWYSNYSSMTDLFLSIVCIVMIIAIWLVPKITIKKRVAELFTGKNIEVVVYPDEIQIGKGSGQWQIPLDGTSTYQEVDDLIVITTPSKTAVAFPIRCIEPSALGEIQAMLMAGTIILNDESLGKE